MISWRPVKIVMLNNFAYHKTKKRRPSTLLARCVGPRKTLVGGLAECMPTPVFALNPENVH